MDNNYSTAIRTVHCRTGSSEITRPVAKPSFPRSLPHRQLIKQQKMHKVFRKCSLPHRQLRKRRRGPVTCLAGSLPHRQLRKARVCIGAGLVSSLPHRQLRKVCPGSEQHAPGSLPHRQLRKRTPPLRPSPTAFTAAHAAQTIFNYIYGHTPSQSRLPNAPRTFRLRSHCGYKLACTKA